LAVRGDRIVAVGRSDSVRRVAGPRARAVDLAGRTVIPGLNDAHAHPGPELRGTRIAAATGDAGLLEVVRALAAASRVRPRGTWLLATVGDRVLDDPRANRFFLDSVAPDHPVVLESWSGHVAILNSATRGSLGIGHDTPDPPGGHYGRVPGSGVRDGRLSEYAWWSARRRLSSSVPDSASRVDLRRYAAAAARFGITTVQDMNTALTTARAVALLRAADVPIRWRVIRFPMTRAGGRDVADARATGPSPDRPRRRYGPGRTGAAQPLRSLLAAGVPIALGSDGPMNPYLNIMFAVTHPVNPGEALDREQAVLAYTRGSAYAEFAEREKGMLAPGMLADLAVLSQDIFTVPLGELAKTESVLTLVGGKVAYDAGVVK